MKGRKSFKLPLMTFHYWVAFRFRMLKTLVLSCLQNEKNEKILYIQLTVLVQGKNDKK